jgi:hypothetical protein
MIHRAPRMAARSAASFVLLAVAGCASWHVSTDATGARRDAKVLEAHATAENLATAALLFESSSRLQRDSPDALHALELIQQAEGLRPQRPELVWLHLSMCRVLQCDSEQDIEVRLEKSDPDNGFAWLAELERANASGSDARVTEAVQRMASASAMDLYWNRLWVMVIDALAAADPSLTPLQRGLWGAGTPFTAHPSVVSGDEQGVHSGSFGSAGSPAGVCDAGGAHGAGGHGDRAELRPALTTALVRVG